MTKKSELAENNTKIRNKNKVGGRTKFVIIGTVCTILIVIAVVCAIIFVPKLIDKDADYPSSYPDYFSNLKEEKEAFSRALDACNKTAEAKLAANGIKTEYREKNLDIVLKYAGYNSRINAAYIELGDVKPTGGDTKYEEYERTYHCYANISGASVYELWISWDDKNE